MSDINEWELRAKAHRSWTQPEEQRVIDVLASMLRGSISPRDAAKAVNGSNGVGWLWYILCDAIRHLGGSLHISEQLVELLNALANLSIVTDGTPWHYSGFAALPGPKLPQSWHVTFREYGIEIVPYDEQIDNKDEFYGQAAEYLNAHTFAATLLVHGEFAGDMFYEALTALRYALETGYDPDYLDQEWRVLLPAASTCILIAARELWEICQRGRANVAPAPERWTLWKEKFRAFSTSASIDENCREYCTKAVSRMEEVESV